MKFRCERDVLVDALTAANRGAGRGGTMIRVHVDGDTVTCTGTDLDIAVEASATVAGTAAGTVLLPAHLVLDVVKSCPSGAVTVATLDTPDGTAMITASRASFDLRTGPLDEWPRQDWLDDVTPASTSARELADGFARVVPAASTDDSRPVLCGVLLEAAAGGLRVVGTDSYRLAIVDLPDVDVLTVERALVPGRALAELVRLVPADDGTMIDVRFGDKAVCFTAPGLRVLSRLIVGEYPKYANLVRTDGSRTGRLSVDCDTLKAAVKQVRLLASEHSPVRVNLDPDRVTLTAASQDVGAAEVVVDAATYDGPAALTVGFNPTYLADALNACPGPKVELDVVDNLRPAEVRSPGFAGFVEVLMPVRFT